MKDCCNDVLKRLDLLDEILKQLKALQDQNAAMKKDLEDLKAQHAAMGAPGGGAAEPQRPPVAQGPEQLRPLAITVKQPRRFRLYRRVPRVSQVRRSPINSRCLA